MTERDFPAVWLKAQDHRLIGGGLFICAHVGQIPIRPCFNHRKEISMSRQTRSASPLRRFWKPALATGAGGTSLLIWFEEIIAFGVEFVSVLFLLILAGPIYLLNHFVFKSATPKPDDKNN
jgi:hypothetical protein